MTSLSLEEIVKWAIAGFLIVIGLYLLYINFIPGASEQFWGKINNATGFLKIGQEKLDYEFEMPSYMVDNVETINETIYILQDKNIPVEATPGEVIEQSLELKDFKGCELTVNQDYKGDLKLMVKNVKGQIKYYKTNTPYSPCILDLENYEAFENYKNSKNYENIYNNIKFVERINFEKLLFPTRLSFRVYKEEEDDEIYEGDYLFPQEFALIKIGKNICFVGYRFKAIKRQ